MDLESTIKEILESLVSLRKDIHQHPETGFKEHRTQGKILEYFTDQMFKVTKCAGTGLVIDLWGTMDPVGSSPKLIALRADIDALAMTEGNMDLSYRSINQGAAHMCGHDGHLTCLVGAAILFSRVRNLIPKNYGIRFLFQPAEEGPGGARPMIKEGALEGVDEIYGMHNWPGIPVGQLRTISGPCMAHVTEFEITVRGKGGHASQPQVAVDPVLVASHVVIALQSIISRNLHPKEIACVSVTCVHGGEICNVIPDVVTLKGTTRDISVEVFDLIKSRMETIVEQTCASFGAKGTLKFFGTEYPPLVNTPKETENVIRVASEVFGSENVSSEGLPMLGAEDFADFVKEKPGCYFFLGTTQEGKSNNICHSTQFDFNDNVIPVAIKIWIRLVEDRFGVKLFQ